MNIFLALALALLVSTLVLAALVRLAPRAGLLEVDRLPAAGDL